MKKILFCLLPLIISLNPLWSNEQIINDRIITSIQVSGLRRTREEIVIPSLERFLGRDADSMDPNEVNAVILDMIILEPINVELIDSSDGVILVVHVEEKWSIFPVPLVTSGSGGTNFGLFIAETNAFGMRDQIAVGGMYRRSGWMLMAMYQFNPRRTGGVGWNANFTYNRNEITNIDSNETLLRRYSTELLRLSFGIRLPLNEISTASFNLSFSNINLLDNPNAMGAPETGARLFRFNPGITFRLSSFDGILLSQKSISLDYGFNLLFFNKPYHQAELRTIFEHSFLPGLRMVYRSGIILTSGTDSQTDPLFEHNPQRAQVNILPNNFSAKHYAGFSLGLEKSLLSFSWGTFSLLGSWQLLFSGGPPAFFQLNHGPSAGFRFYLNRLALPALGLDFAYNIQTRRRQFSINMGMSF